MTPHVSTESNAPVTAGHGTESEILEYMRQLAGKYERREQRMNTETP